MTDSEKLDELIKSQRTQGAFLGVVAGLILAIWIKVLFYSK